MFQCLGSAQLPEIVDCLRCNDRGATILTTENLGSSGNVVLPCAESCAAPVIQGSGLLRSNAPLQLGPKGKCLSGWDGRYRAGLSGLAQGGVQQQLCLEVMCHRWVEAAAPQEWRYAKSTYPGEGCFAAVAPFPE